MNEENRQELIRIFAADDRNPGSRFDDTKAIELLHLLQRLARAEQLKTPVLDRYLAKEYSAIPLRNQIQQMIRDLLSEAEIDLPPALEMTEEEYCEACKYLPKAYSYAFPKPEAVLDPYRNLLAIWEMELHDKIGEEIWYGSDEIRDVYAIVRDYIFICSYGWESSLGMCFFHSWNRFILEGQWQSLRVTEALQQALEKEQEYSRNLRRVVADQCTRLDCAELAAEEQFITLTEAARKALEAEFGHRASRTEVNTLMTWLSRKIGDAPFLCTRENGPKYYRCMDVIALLTHAPRIKMMPAQLGPEIRAAGTPKSKIR